MKWLKTILIITLLGLMSCNKNSTGPNVYTLEPLGLEARLVSNLFLDGDYLYACANRDGLYQYNIKKRKWTHLGLADETLTRFGYGVTSVYSDYTNNLLLVGTLTPTQKGPGIFVSTDYGKSWNPSDTGVSPEILDISGQVHSMCGVSYPKNIIYIGMNGTIFKSTQNGKEWKHVYGSADVIGNGIDKIAIAPSDPNKVWAALTNGYDAPILEYSNDGGDSWTKFRKFPYSETEFFSLGSVKGIVIDPLQSGTVYISLNDFIFKTRDNGQTWEKLFSGIYFSNLAINPVNTKELLAFGEGVYHTTNAGKTWHKQADFDSTGYVKSSCVDWYKRIMYVGTINSTLGDAVYATTFPSRP